MIFIFGSTRSGSTWLGKLFDSHPDTLYLHEPDISYRGSDLLPFWFEREPTPQEIDNAKIYLKRISTARHSRTIGIRPFFRKHYRGAMTENARLGLIYGGKLLERAGLAALVDRLEIPDLATRGTPSQIVIKSVSALGRAEALLAADPSILPVLLIRHPCAFVDSMLRGEKLGVMTKSKGLQQLAATRSARRLGLDANTLQNADEVTALAWTWLLSNAEAHPAIKRANGTILVYEDLADEPARVLKGLFEKLALGWPEETEAFLTQSQKMDGDYYSVFRNPREASQRWRRELDESTTQKIRAIVCQDKLGEYFFDR